MAGTPGIVSHWRLGEASGTTAADSVGANPGAYNGTNTRNQTGALTGDANTAVLFSDAGSVGTVTVPNATSINRTSYSIEFWVKYTQFGATTSGRQLIHKDPGASNRNIWIGQQPGSNALEFNFNTSSGYYSLAATQTPALNTWYHYVFTLGSGNINIYIDGAPHRNGTYAGTLLTNNAPIIFANQLPNQGVRVVLDEVAYYSTVLNATQVADHYGVAILDTTITAGPSGTINTTTPQFSFTGNGSSLQCRVDAAAFATCTSPFTTAALGQGAHTFQVRAVSGASVDGSPASRSFTVDTVAPDTTITGGPSGLTNTATPQFTFTSTEGGSTFQCRVDAAAFATCTSPFTTAALGQGAHTFEVRATDSAGNTDASPASRSFTVDTVAPDTTITGGPTGTINTTTPQFTFTSTESGTFQCRVDAAAFATCTTPFTTAALSQGAHTFEVRAVDAVGNTDASPASRAFTVDTVPPDTTITGGPSGPTNTTTPQFTFTSTEAGTFQCRVDAAAFATCTSPFTTAALSQGAHTFEVRAIDAVGNTDASPASRSFTVDTTAPDTTLTGGPTTYSTTTTPQFTFTSTEAGTFQCRVDAAAFATCTSPHTTAALSQGAHTFEVRAIDAAGNIDASPASRSFTVDSVAPDTTITSGPSGPTNVAAPTFAFTASEASTFQCRVDAAAFATCTSPFTTATLSQGAHTFEVRATDTAGNVDASPASRAFTVDTTAPTVTITAGPSGPVSNTNPPFSFTANEAGSTFQCRIDAAAFATCTSPHSPGALSQGPHTFQVQATDLAGSTSTTASRAFTVDTVAPDTTITSGASGSINENTPTFEFTSTEAGTFQCRVDAAAFATCTSPFTTQPLTEGAHTFQVRAVDSAGNIDASPATASFSVDVTPPDTTILSAPPNPTTSSAVSITFSGGDTYECALDGAAFSACTTPYTATLADGPHSFEVRATDSVGNTDPNPASVSFFIDTVGPTTPGTPAATPNPTTGPIVLTWTASTDDGTGLANYELQVSRDGGAFTALATPPSNSFSTTVLNSGTYRYRVRAVDGVNLGSGWSGESLPVFVEGAPALSRELNAKAAVGIAYVLNASQRLQVAGARPITFSRCAGPSDFTVDANLGTVTWTPSAAGTVTVCVRAENSYGDDSFTYDIAVVDRAPTTVQAVLNANPREGNRPLTVQYDALSSIVAADASPFFALWDFGDGAPPDTLSQTSNAYRIPGTYRPRLVVTDAYGAKDDADAVIEVRGPNGERPPSARIVASATQGEGSLEVSFRCDCADGSASLSGLSWNLGNGERSNSSTPTTRYEPGRYHVRLTAVDINGLTSTDEVEIVVSRAGALPPDCSAYVTPPANVAPVGARWVGVPSVASGTLTERWRFSDSDVVESREVLRAYEVPLTVEGTYEVTDTNGLTCTDSVALHVLGPEGTRPPEIHGIAELEALCGEGFDSQVIASGEGPLSFSVGSSGLPVGMTLDANGHLTWAPSRGDAGERDFSIVTSNGVGTTEQTFHLSTTCEATGRRLRVGCSVADASWAGGVVLVLSALMRRRRNRAQDSVKA